MWYNTQAISVSRVADTGPFRGVITRRSLRNMNFANKIER